MEITNKVIVEKMPILHFPAKADLPEALDKAETSKSVVATADKKGVFVKNWLPDDDELLAMETAIKSGKARLLTVEKQRALLSAVTKPIGEVETKKVFAVG